MHPDWSRAVEWVHVMVGGEIVAWQGKRQLMTYTKLRQNRGGDSINAVATVATPFFGQTEGWELGRSAAQVGGVLYEASQA